MSKRQHDASTLATTDQLIDLLKSACENPSLLQTIAEHQESSAVIAEFNRLLAGTTAEGNDAKRQKRAQNRPQMLNEVLFEVMFFADRDDLDTMQLSSRFMLDVIRERETAELPLRPILQVDIGTVFDNRASGSEHFWLPIAQVTRGWLARDFGTTRVFNTIHQLVRHLRLAYCEKVNFNLYHLQWMSGDDFERVCGVVSDDLFAQDTNVGAMDFRTCDTSANSVMRSVNAFKSVKDVTLVHGALRSQDAFDEDFFISLFQRGVHRFHALQRYQGIRLSIDATTALAFGFSEPTAGMNRELVGVDCRIEKDFLHLVRNKTSELGVYKPIDFKFTISELTARIGPAGFEHYKKNDGTWVLNDLENKATVEVKQTEKVVEIHVYSSH